MASLSFTADWLHILDRISPGDLETTHALAQQHADALADCFYDALMTDLAAQKFLNHQLVRSRLHSSLQGWIIEMCDPASRERVHEIYEQQVKIGEIHARVGVPISLVLKGARLLKRAFTERVLATNQAMASRLACLQAFDELLDLSMEAMSAAYTASIDQKARSNEAYRLFSLTENLATERERQRAALLDWESRFMFEAAVATEAPRLPELQKSEFGLWFRHKAMYAFQGVDEIAIMTATIKEIDGECLPELATPSLSSEQRFEAIHRTRRLAEVIRTQMAVLFNKGMEVESGKDVLTGLLNRRFLASILSREVELARQHNKPFSVAAIDIDHFKSVNDTYGHEAGDVLLVEFANLLQRESRGGDFIFRTGGEEFLIIMVDTTAQQALAYVQRLEQSIRERAFILPNRSTHHLTVSMGVGTHDGHPDYQRLLRQADRALYEAKRAGRNRIQTI